MLQLERTGSSHGECRRFGSTVRQRLDRQLIPTEAPAIDEVGFSLTPATKAPSFNRGRGEVTRGIRMTTTGGIHGGFGFCRPPSESGEG